MLGFYRDLFTLRQNARKWAVPSFLPAKLRRDGRARIWNALVAPLLPTAIIMAPLLAIAPPSEFSTAVLIAVVVYLTWSLVHFTWRDLNLIVVRLEEDGIRRNTRPFLFSPFGMRDKSEYWSYDMIRDYGIVAPGELGHNFAALVVVTSDSIATIVIPKRINTEQVREELIATGVDVKRLREIPEKARPQPRAEPRSKIRVAISAGVAVIALSSSLLLRNSIHGKPSGASREDLLASIEGVKIAQSVRKLSLGGSTGVAQGRAFSEKGSIWARTKDHKHLLWTAGEPKPTTTIDLPGNQKYLVDYSPDGKSLAFVSGRKASIWNLAPCEKVGEFDVQFEVRSINISADGARLVTTSMGLVNVYDLKTGAEIARHKIPTGVLVATRCSPDRKSYVVVQPKAIYRVDFDTGEVTPVIEFTQSGAYYAHGSISMNCKWVVLRGRDGAYAVDLKAGKREFVLDLTSTSGVYINNQGNRIAAMISRNLVIWSVADGKPVRKLDTGYRTNIDLTHDGEHLLISSPLKREMLVVPMVQ